MAAKYEIKAGKTGKFSFNLVAANGQKILTSETYNTRQAAVGGIESVRKNAGNDGRFERKAAKDKSPFFVLKAGNGEPLGRSEMYSSKSAMEKGIRSVKKNAGAHVVDAK